jgi:ubiquinone/menaquinone biosynthesis C-methylase UbiE
MYTLKEAKEAYTYYARIPFLYNLFHRLPFLRGRAVSKLGLKPGDKVLDIACGTGLNFSHVLRKIGRKGSIIGVDYNKEMLKIAGKIAKQHKNIRLIQADASKLKLKRNYFDAVISALGFSAIPDHKNALINAVKSLKPRKKLIMLEGKLFNFKPLNLIMPILRWNKSWDKNKDLIGDTKRLFPHSKIIAKQYNLGSLFILELTKY